MPVVLSKSLGNKNGWQEVDTCSIKKSSLHYHYEKTYEPAKIENEVRVILKRRDVSHCRIKSGSWLKGPLLAYLPKDLYLFIKKIRLVNSKCSENTKNYLLQQGKLKCTEFLFYSVRIFLFYIGFLPPYNYTFCTPGHRSQTVNLQRNVSEGKSLRIISLFPDFAMFVRGNQLLINTSFVPTR